jgi:hypothetical protein
MAALVGGLGGAAGFGESSLPRGDDASTGFISLASAFPQGLTFLGRTFTGLYVNTNGSITLAAPSGAFTPTAITGATGNPIIAPFWADVDTRGGATAATPGGNSLGTNLVYYDQDAGTGTFTVTWDDVGYFNQRVNKLDAFQLRLTRVGTTDFNVEFRYEDINWTTGDASGGSNGLGGTGARAGFSLGDGAHFYELGQSGSQTALLDLENASNARQAGLYRFEARALTGAEGTSGLADGLISGQTGTVNTLHFFAGRHSATIETGLGEPLRVTTATTGMDNLYSIEILDFVDGRMVYDAHDPAAQVVRMYQAGLGRTPDQTGLNGWISFLQHGLTLETIADGFLNSQEFAARFTNASNIPGFVTQLYANVLGRAPDSEGYLGWVNALNSGSLTKAQVLVGFSESAENVQRTGDLVLAGIWDRDENATLVARLYDTVLGRQPDLNGLAGWVDMLEHGTALGNVVAGFVNSSEFQGVYGALDDRGFIQALYRNTLEREGSPVEVNAWLDVLGHGSSRPDIVLGFSESQEHTQNTAALIQPETGAFGIIFA